MEAPIVELYPRDAHGYVRQCAWCRRVADRHGRYRIQARTILDFASHGCCDLCAALFERQTQAYTPAMARAAAAA